MFRHKFIYTYVFTDILVNSLQWQEETVRARCVLDQNQEVDRDEMSACA